MRLSISTLVTVSAAVLLSTSCLVDGKKSNVVDLTTTKAFDAAIGKGQGALVEFFAPWCGHCKKLAPTYEELADAFASKKDKVIIAKVDADNNRALGKAHGVQGFPTLKWFPAHSKEGEVYSGIRDLKALSSYVTEMSNVKSNIRAPPPPAAKQLTKDNFDEIVLDEANDVFVEFYAPWCGHCKNLAPVYDKVASAFENEKNCIVAQMDADDAANRDIAQRYGVSGFPTLMMFPKGSKDKKPVPYQQSRAEEDLVQYLNEQCYTHRAPGGGLTDLAWRLPLLDTLASRFFVASPTSSGGKDEDRASILEEAKSFVAKYSTSANATEAKNAAAKYYLKVMDKAIAKPSYIEEETKRLANIIKKHVDGTSALASAKFDDIKRRANILAAFAKREMSEKSAEAAKKITKGVDHSEL
ncbi:disulfide isomerase [Acaromyces ingoldii]|uniref:protein disulfide-isomerase n=1 Tax=Acaromyces ingoldii TaxID=215250 RepID=A0A316YWK1_9BASI|nr:disulfide isomerase [Acaromyces ingoldii]PWN93797.1 disulfide isomerase [Acaromyces ingoldii]